MAEELFDILIKGPGPYGFRLFGGNDDPLIVAKLRARSKAHDAGLREGDVVLGINGRSLQRVSHGIAMALLENAQESIHLHLYRGPTDRNSVSAVYNKVGHQLRPVSPGTAPPNRSVANQPSPAPFEPTASQRVQVPVQSSEPGRSGEMESQQGKASYSRQEVTSSEGNVTQKITTETQDLGGVTLTKVTRHVVTGSDSDATWTSTDEPNTTKKTTLFHVPKVKAQPLLWSPDGTAVSDHFQVNKGITVDFSSVEGKENITPKTGRGFGGSVNISEEPHKFKVYKTTAKPLVWQPSNVPSLPVREPSPALAFKILDTQDYQSERKHEEEPTKRYKGEEKGVGSEDPFGLNPHLIHVLTTEGTSEDFTLTRKKKIFADSSFYDDPEQKYPTIEEQIKMARKVALSLSAPDNVTARGQRMFLKRKEKANLWSSDQAFEGSPAFIPQSRSTGGRKHKKAGDDNPYYNPTPWNAPQTKKVEKVAWEVTKERLEGYLEDQEASSVTFAKNRLLFERGFDSRGQEHAAPKKAPSGSNMARHQCIGLTNDLKGMKGKGAKLFAQRRAKAAEEEAAEWQQSEGEREVAPTINRSEERRSDLNLDPNQETARRLEELISISKAYLSPWETRQNIPLPWQNAVATIDVDEGTRRAANDDVFRPGQKTAGDIPNFLAKTTSVSSYRPVKFQIASNGPGPGITDF